MPKFIGFLLFPLALISQSSSQSLALAGLGQGLNGKFSALNNVCSFSTQPYYGVSLNHLNRLGLKDLDQHYISLIRHLGDRSYLLHYQNFGNEYYQENQCNISFGSLVLKPLRVGLELGLITKYRVEYQSYFQSTSRMMVHLQFTPSLFLFTDYKMRWPTELKEQTISTEVQWWPNKILCVLAGLQFDFEQEEQIRLAWQLQLSKHLLLQQAISHGNENKLHFGLQVSLDKWASQISMAYAEYSAWQLGIGLHYVWQ